MAKVTGIGGIFFKSDRPTELKEWYAKNLGMPVDKYGWSFTWIDRDTDQMALTQWSIVESRSKHFDPSKQPFMINYRVDDLEALLAQLRDEGIDQVGTMETFDYGKFAWILDPDGNKIELWEPIDQVLL